ncbi:chorismate mutase [Candidatus Marinamargulisbacteria bacterium SCGC AG-439-L15]|nr:chorismate mutase [Candidatus Marinamargulisbacteria bacterium SCGC AG-439-L15]
MSCRGIRGATTVEENSEKAILSETKVLLKTMFSENGIDIDEVASIFFSLTPNLNATFPAQAARELGLTNTPLFCLQEVDVPDSLKSCIRLLIHVNTTKKQSEMTHVYLKKAVSLRPDQAKK